jgi:hypothetical protein
MRATRPQDHFLPAQDTQIDSSDGIQITAKRKTRHWRFADASISKWYLCLVTRKIFETPGSSFMGVESLTTGIYQTSSDDKEHFFTLFIFLSSSLSPFLFLSKCAFHSLLRWSLGKHQASWVQNPCEIPGGFQAGGSAFQEEESRLFTRFLWSPSPPLPPASDNITRGYFP